MAKAGQIPAFEFNKPAGSPSGKPGEVKSEKKDQQPETPKFNDTTPEGIGKNIAKEFTSAEQKNIVASELAKGISENFSKFTPDFQAKYGTNGKPDMSKILELYGLKPHLNDQFTPEGNVKPAPATDPNAPKTALEFGSASAGQIPLLRPKEAPTGKIFMAEMQALGNMNDKGVQAAMERRVMEEIAKGNIPDFCRPENMKAMKMSKDGITVNFKAGLDYLAVGSNKDFVRVPITPLLAKELSARYGWGMPTREMAHSIHDNADIKLTGVGLVQNDADQLQMQGIGFIQEHNSRINQQLGPKGMERLQSGKALVAGHKKDVIISRYVIDHPDGALDYSGLYCDGKNPIQDNPAHEWTYRDYSHGFRPIDSTVAIAYPDGKTVTMNYYDALKDPKIAKVLNGAEGAFDAAQAYNNGRQKSVGESNKAYAKKSTKKSPSSFSAA